MKRLALALAVLLSACQTTFDPTRATHDLAGNIYPTECRRDLSHMQAEIRVISALEMLKQSLVVDGHTLGLTGLIGGRNVIFIRDDITGWRRDDVIHHERCHFLMGRWHS